MTTRKVSAISSSVPPGEDRRLASAAPRSATPTDDSTNPAAPAGRSYRTHTREPALLRRGLECGKIGLPKCRDIHRMSTMNEHHPDAPYGRVEEGGPTWCGTARSRWHDPAGTIPRLLRSL